MEAPVVIALGALVAILASLPQAHLFERALKENARVGLAAGLASVLFSFLTLTAAVLVVYLVTSESVLGFGCAAVSAFLLLWAAESLRAWRCANRASRGREGRNKRGQSA